MLGFRKSNKDGDGPAQRPSAGAPDPGSRTRAPVSGTPVGSSGHFEGPTKKLGRILLEEKLINQSQLDAALAFQKERGGFLGEILVEMGSVKQEAFILCLVKQCKIPHLNLLDYEISKEVLQTIPKDLCWRYNLLPIDKLGRILTIAMVNPLDTEALEQIRRVRPELRIKPILCDWEHFRVVVSRMFGAHLEGGGAELDAGMLLLGPKRMRPAPAETSSGKPVETDTATPAALKAAVDTVLREAGDAEEDVAARARQEAEAVSGDPSAPDISTVVREGVGGAMQEAMASLMAHHRSGAGGPGGLAPVSSGRELAEIIRESVGSAMQEALAPLAAQLRGGSAPDGVPQPASAEALSDVVRSTVREALREGEAAAVGRANRQDLEIRDAEKARRLKHSSVSTFAAGRRRVSASLDNPELQVESDARVLDALNAERLLDTFTFDGFFFGKSNAFTRKLSEAVAAHPGGAYNPFFLYGDVGLGKTHLINAIGNAIFASDSEQRVGYVSSSRFASRLAEAARDGAADAFRVNYCHWDVLILDDIQFLGGRVEAQEEFFHIFNGLQQEERQIVIAGDKPPDRLGLLEQRLISRFASGIVANLRPPEREARMAILRRHVVQLGVDVNDEILSLIAMRVSNDVRKMIGALCKAAAYAELVGEPISCEMTNEILSHLLIEEAA
jgi:chromosomal replication initiator protein DnaA